jgi:hypothetical protein
MLFVRSRENVFKTNPPAIAVSEKERQILKRLHGEEAPVARHPGVA